MQKTVLKLCLVLAVFMTVSCVTTQSRLERNQLNAALHQRAVDAVMRAQFVLEANNLVFRRGNMVHVTGNTNFVALQDGTITIQTSSNWGWPGPNSLGGFTYEARPSRIKVRPDNRGNMHVTMYAQGPVFSGRIVMTIMAGSNIASATVRPTFNRGKITFNGVVLPAEEARIFRGRAL